MVTMGAGNVWEIGRDLTGGPEGITIEAQVVQR
jgi:hypothetical protein